MSPRLFLHGDSIVSPLFQATGWSLWLCRKPTCRFLFITIRVIIFASWCKKKDVPVRGPLLRSHNLAPCPQVWTIDSSWPLQNSSLVYLGLEIRSLPFMARPPPDESAISCDYSRSFCQPHLLQRPSGIVSWATYRPLLFSYLTGCSK